MGRQIDYAALARQHGGVAVESPSASARAPEPDFEALAQQHGGAAVLEPMDLAVSHLRPGERPPQTVGRFAREATQSINPVNIAAGVSQSVLHPVDTATGMLSEHDRMRREAQEAFGRGDYLSAARHALQYGIPIATGVIGGALGMGATPAGAAAGMAGGYGLGVGLASRLDDASERFGEGDTAGGLGATVDAATMGVLGARGAMPAQRTAGTPAPRRTLSTKARRVLERVTPTNLAPDEASAVAFARERGIPLDVGTATGRQLLKNVQKATGPYGPAEAFRASQERNLSRVGADLVAEVGPRAMTATTVGEGVRAALQTKVRGLHDLANDAYTRLRAAEIAAPEEFVQARPARPVASHVTPEQSFPLRWLARDLEEFQYQPGGTSLGARRRAYESLDPVERDALMRNPRVAGTPVQEMFEAMGVKGSRPEIATKIEKFLRGELKEPRFAKLADVMNEAWDGQNFDFDLVSDESLTALGVRRRDLRSPIGLPDFNEPGAAGFFPDEAVPAAPKGGGTGDTSMRLAVNLADAKAALRPLYDELQREREITGNLMGPKGRAAVALESLMTGPDFAPLTTVDAALGPIKALTRGAPMKQLRDRGQGLASKVVGELETAVRERAQSAGPEVAQALSEGRAATRMKYQTADVMKRLTGARVPFEPQRIFNALTSRRDSGIDRLRALQREAPDALPDVARAYLEEAIGRAQGAGGILEHSRALWSSWEKLGPETRARLFPGEGQIKALNDYFTLVKKMGENPNPSGTASVMQAGLSPHKILPRAILARVLYAPEGPQRLMRATLMLKSPSKPARAAALAELARAVEVAGIARETIPALAADAETQEPSQTRKR